MLTNIFKSRQLALTQIQLRNFAKWQDPKNDHLTEEYIEKQKKIFEQNLTTKQKKLMQAQRILQLEKSKIENNIETSDKTLWWNKVMTMDEEEFDMLPYGFVKKYGTFAQSVAQLQQENRSDESRAENNMYDQVKSLNKLMTNEEQEQQEKYLVDQHDNGLNDPDNYDKTGYMSRQPRMNLREKNFNFEQFQNYTHKYEAAREKDEHKSKEFYKLVKYVKAHKDDEKVNQDLIVRDFMKKYKLDLIDIPEEFQDLEVPEDFKPKRSGRQSSRKRVYTKRNNDISDYDSWRSFDRSLNVVTGKDTAVCKLLIPPALLKRAFGTPDRTQLGFDVSGMYDFEDTNLDCYRIVDYKQTDLYWGYNREDEHYNTVKNLKKPIYKRNRKWPSYEEFWALDEPKPFRLMASESSDWRKFKRWMRKHLAAIEQDPDFDYDKQALQQYESSIDLCLGDFDEKSKINTDMAIFKFSNLEFMKEEEIKNLSEAQKTMKKPPTPVDLSKAEKVVIDKSELKIQEIQAEQEQLSNFI